MALLGLWAGLFVSAAPASASERQAQSPHVPRAAKLARPVGRLPGSQRLNLAIGLPLRNRPELTRFIEQLYDPSQSQYHQYLAPDQFTAKFGPSAADYQAVIAFAQANGFTVTATHPNRMLLDVNTAVADLERAFHISLRRYPHPKEARTFYAPDTEPALDLAVPLLHISGLDDYTLPRANLTVHPGKPGTNGLPAVGTGPNGTYWGIDFRTAYARGVTLNGAGQMLGLFELDGYYPNDIKNYESQAGLAKVPLIDVLLDGFDGTPGKGNVEVALDIEMAAAMAPGLSAIIVYQTDSQGLPNDVLNRMATDNLAKQLSASWSFGIDATTTQIFQQFAAQGQSYFNASGDGGAYSGSPDPPTDNPYVTSVGGTTLRTFSGGVWSSEAAWNLSDGSGTGGGISTTYAIPSWQQSVDMTTNQGSPSQRNLPDVAMIADAVWSIFDNGNSGYIQGTSCGAPLWAGLMAMVNQQAAALGQPAVGFINPAIYAIGLGPGYTTNFHDITTGSNTNANSLTNFFAVPGYDLCTGWGTPIGQNLINTLAPRTNAIAIVSAGATLAVEGCLPANAAIDPGETVTVNFSLKNVGAVRSTNLVAVLQADNGVVSPSTPQTYGALTGGGSAVSRPFTFTANGSCGSNLIATLQLSDGTASLGSLAFSFGLGKPVTTFTQNFDGVTAPALPSDWTTFITGNVSNWITASTVRDSAPNSAFVFETTNTGLAELTSPPIQISTSLAQLVFRQNYNMEIYFDDATKAYDGGVLEIQIGSGLFKDILTAGGSFASGGYTQTIQSEAGNESPLRGRQVWSGLSGGFITTIVNLPAAAAGQSVRFKWRFATDSGNFGGGLGWYLDNVTIQDGYLCCNSSADLAVSHTASSEPALLQQPLTYSLAVANAGPLTAHNVFVTDTLSTNVTFLAASSGGIYTNGAVIWNLGALPINGLGAVTVTVTPFTTDPITNVVTVASLETDPNTNDNSSTLVTTVVSNGVLPSISSGPIDTVVVQGASATFQVTASGIPSPAYQWFFNGTNLLDSTTSILTLTNVQASQAGGYLAIVTNLIGSATSSVAQLSVLVPPTLSLESFGLTATNVSLTLTSVLGRNYILEYKDSLTDTNWTPLLPALPGNGAVLLLLDTNPPSLSSRYYRVNQQ